MIIYFVFALIGYFVGLLLLIFELYGCFYADPKRERDEIAVTPAATAGPVVWLT